MDAVQKCRQEYLVAKENLLKKTEVGGVMLCVRGRAYRAMSMAPQFQAPDKLPAFVQTFNKLAGEANLLINAYNDAGFAYTSFAHFAAQDVDTSLPDCDCDWCKKLAGQPTARAVCTSN